MNKVIPHPASPVPSSAPAGLVLAKALGRATERLGLTNAFVGNVIGVSESTVSRLRANDRPLDPESKAGELALLLIRVFRSLDALVGNDQAKRMAWLGSYNRGLNGKPQDLLRTAQGLVTVVSYLDSMRATL